MSDCVELHDSVVITVDRSNDELILKLADVILHRSSGTAGVDEGKVYSLSLDVILSDASVVCPFGELPTRLESGNLKIGETHYENCLPYPHCTRCNVDLELIDERGNLIRIVALGLEMRPTSGESYVEDYPGSE